MPEPKQVAPEGRCRFKLRSCVAAEAEVKIQLLPKNGWILIKGNQPMSKTRKILLCGCVKYRRIPQTSLDEIIAAAKNDGIEVALTPDLCRVAAEQPEQLRNSDADVVVACYSRAIKALFDYAGAELPQNCDLRSGSVESVLNELELAPAATSTTTFPEVPGDWVPWFPIIDRERCVACGKCVDFCLFGVYKRDPKTKKIEVIAPQNCKTNCPACARMCPDTAIIFPKHEDSPINGGEGDSTTPVKIDTQATFDHDLYSKLAARRSKKRSADLYKK
ncbi:MAG: ferredoxin family protein [Victivallaceae bacterium]|nr:ferredoxin family protein [Victivallaceae bacterium]